MTAPSLSQIRAQVREVLDRWPERRRIGIRSPASWSGPSSVELDAGASGTPASASASPGRMRVVSCRSSLELRQRLLESEGSDDVWVFLADLAPTELEADVRSRLAKGRLLEPERWQTVRGLFGLRKGDGQVDPRLVRHGWMAEALIAAAPPAGYRPVAGAVLDEDAARRALLEHRLGLAAGAASPAAVLDWASAPGTAERYASAPEELRRELAEWLAPSAGPASEVLAALLAAGHGVDAVPLGLVADVLWRPDAPVGDGVLILLSERYLDRLRPSPESARAWAEAAAQAVARRHADGGVEAVEPWLRRAEAVLDELDAGALAIASDWLPRAFEERLARAVESLERWLRERASPLTAADAAADALARHGLARRYAPRVEALERAAALARWLSRPPSPAADLGAAVLGYADDGAWVDLARQEVGRGDTSETAARVYGRLASAVEEEREGQNRRFAELLRDAGASPPEHPRVAGVEDVLARWAAPLARRGPLLVLVLDGLGQVVWRQLRDDLLRPRVWREIVPDTEGRCVGLAVLPTETRTSRASLCRGTLAAGTSADERRGFAEHASLAPASGGRPPRLFAPGEVKAAGGGVAAEVADEIHGPRVVVGVVLSEVDAYFESMSDLRSPFEAETLGPLRGLLELAARAGRVVLITGDHGQVPGTGTELRRPDGEYGGRHRSGDEEPGEGEITIIGRRVLAERNRVVVPWSERPRYRKGGRAGYHGGATPREMVVPVAVLAPAGVDVEGWQPLDEQPPLWWKAEPSPPSPLPGVGAHGVRPAGAHGVRPAVAHGVRPAQMSLLEPPAEPSVASVWLDRLLASEVWAQQKSLAGRRPPPDAQVRRLLETLAAGGGVATMGALAHRLGAPRLRGLLTQASRLLNVDGFGVLTVDETAETVRLDRPLLEKQFGLGEPRR